jgi:hypothetical protein
MSPSELNDCAAAGLDHWSASETEVDSDEPQETRQRARSENVASSMAVIFFMTNNVLPASRLVNIYIAN